MPLAIPAAIVGAAVVGGVASTIASGKASSTAQKVATQNNALQTDIYNQNKAALSPYEGAGTGASSTINAALGLGGDATAASNAFNAFTNSDGYQFRLQQGQKAVTSALGARGYLDSGAAQKSLLTYGQGAASDEFQRWMQGLQTQQGVGLTAASAQAGVGQGFANAVSANNNNAANVSANAALSNAGTINSTVGSALSAYALNQGLHSSYGNAALGGSANAYGVNNGTGDNVY